MANERISSIIAPSAFEELERLQGGLVTIEKQIQSFDKGLGNTKSLSQANEMLMQMSVGIEQVNENLKEQTNVRKQATNALNEELQAQKDYEKQRGIQERFEKKFQTAKAREIKQLNDATNAYKIFSKATAEQQLRYKELALTLGDNHRLTIQAQNDAIAMATRLKQLDANVLQFNRNVGNYNSVGAQFNQLLREVPNAGISARTFLISISNNVTYFAEAIQTALKNGDSLKVIFSQIGKSLFGLMGLINGAVLLLTAFAMNMGKAEKATKTAREELDEMVNSLNNYIKAQKEQSRISSSSFQVEANARKRALAELKAQGATAEEVYNAEEAYLTAKVNGLYDELNVYKDLQSAIKGYALEAEQGGRVRLETEELLAEKLQALGLTTKEIEDKKTEIYKLALNDREALERLYASEIFDINQSILDEQSAQHVAFLEYQNSLKKEEDRQDEVIHKKQKDRLEELLYLSEQVYNRRTEAYNESLTSIDNAEIEIQKRTEQRYADGLITIEEYESEKIRNANTSAERRLRIEIDYLKQVSELIYNPEQRAEMQQRINEAELEIIKIGNSEKITEDKKTASERVKAEKEANDKILALRKSLFTALQALGSVIRDLSGIQSDRLEARIRDLQKEGQLIEDNGRREVESIRNSQLTDEEKEAAIRKQEALTESQRQANEARRKEAAQQKAKFDKAAAISEIILNTSIAVIKAWTEGDPYTKAVRAGAAAAAGAAQIARAQAQPLPAYEHGTFDHVGGKFIAGEKEKELVITKSGKSYWTADKPTVYNEPSGTMVLNSEMINRIFGLAPQLISATSKRGDNTVNISEKIEAAIERGSNNTIRAIRQNRAIQNVKVDSPDYYYMSKVRGKA